MTKENANLAGLICSPIERDTDGAILLRQDGRVSSASFLESRMVAEGFVHTFKRDDVNIHELPDAESVLAQLGAWIDDYQRLAPHSALGMRRPADYARWRQRSVNSRRTWSSSYAR